MLSRACKALGLLATLALVSAGCGGDEGGGSTGASGDGGGSETLKILLAAPLTGDSAETGEDLVNGAKLGIDYVNGQGGIKSGPNQGAQLALQTTDDEMSTQGAATAASQFTSNQDLFAMACCISSGIAAAAGSVLERAQLPLVGAYVGGEFLTTEADNIAPMVTQLSNAGRVAVNLAAELGHKRFGTIAVDEALVEAYVPGLEAETEAQGMEWADRQSFSPDTTDFSPQITNLKQANVEAVLLGAFDADAARIVSQMRQAGLDVPVIDFLGIGWRETYLETAGEAAVGTYGLDAGLVFGAGQGDPLVDQMREKYQQEYGEGMPTAAMYGFDTILTIGKAIEAGATREDLVSVFPQLEGEGLTGQVAFNDELRPESRYFTYTEITSPSGDREVEAVYEATTQGVSQITVGESG